jgi:hypothetical protein
MVNTAVMLIELRNELFAFAALFYDGEGLSFGRTRRIVSSALASRVLTPSGRRRCALATKMLS